MCIIQETLVGDKNTDRYGDSTVIPCQRSQKMEAALKKIASLPIRDDTGHKAITIAMLALDNE